MPGIQCPECCHGWYFKCKQHGLLSRLSSWSCPTGSSSCCDLLGKSCQVLRGQSHGRKIHLLLAVDPSKPLDGLDGFLVQRCAEEACKLQLRCVDQLLIPCRTAEAFRKQEGCLPRPSHFSTKLFLLCRKTPTAAHRRRHRAATGALHPWPKNRG